MMIQLERKFDIALFGASGVTGQYVIEELALHAQGIKWCVAGRNPDKLKSVLKAVGKLVDKNLDGIEILEADANDKASLTAMCKSTRLVINTVGPYRFTGEQVVEECVKNGTHHIDVSGEPEFLEKVQLKYFDAAKEKKVYVVGSCGFDSIPCDVGIEFVRKNFNGDLDSVETYLDGKRLPGTTANFATWQSAIHGVANASKLKPLRRQLVAELFTKKPIKPNYPLKKRGTLFKSEVVNGWCVPFIGSDRSVAMRTQMHNYQFKDQKPVQVQVYMKTDSLLNALATLLAGALFMVMTKFVYGRDLLEKYPEVFSFGVFSRIPPSRELLLGGSLEMRYRAKGWSQKLSNPSDRHTHAPNKTVIAVLKGPDAGYITTSICVVNSALVVLSEANKLPESGGVYTPAAAFSETTLIERLEKRGISIRILDGMN